MSHCTPCCCCCCCQCVCVFVHVCTRAFVCAYSPRNWMGWEESARGPQNMHGEDIWAVRMKRRGLLRKMMCGPLLRSLQSAQPQSQWVSDSAIHSVQWETVAACCTRGGRSKGGGGYSCEADRIEQTVHMHHLSI